MKKLILFAAAALMMAACGMFYDMDSKLASDKTLRGGQ